MHLDNVSGWSFYYDRRGGYCNLYTLTKTQQPAPTPDTEQAAITEEPHAKNVPPRNNCAISYTYSFSAGMQKLFIEFCPREKAANKDRWTGGQSNFIPP